MPEELQALAMYHPRRRAVLPLLLATWWIYRLALRAGREGMPDPLVGVVA